MEKRISYTQFQSVRAVAKAIDPIQREATKLETKIIALIEEQKAKKAQLDALEKGIVDIIGFHVSDLVKKVVETSADGKTKTTKYLPTDMVVYDEKTKQYVIKTEEEEETGACTSAPEASNFPDDLPTENVDTVDVF